MDNERYIDMEEIDEWVGRRIDEWMMDRWMTDGWMMDDGWMDGR